MKRRIRSAKRRSGGFFKRFARRSSSKGTGVKVIQLDAMIYGALRAKMSSALEPITNKIPLGNVSDEVGMGLLTYLVAKNTSGMVSEVAKKGLVIENARIGEALASGTLGGFLNASTNQTGQIYG